MLGTKVKKLEINFKEPQVWTKMNHCVYFDGCPQARAVLVAKPERGDGIWRIETRTTPDSDDWTSPTTSGEPRYYSLDEAENLITQLFANRNMTGVPK